MRTLLCLLLLTTFCLANDRGIDGVGGSWVVMEGEHPTVQMVEEDVRMEAYPALTFTTADFVFANHGEACEVTMGFPESGMGDISWTGLDDKSRFLSFRSQVDGEEVRCQRAKVKYPTDETYETHWLKQVSFARDQTRRVRVEYVSRTGHGAGFYFAHYDFTGGNWQGKVNRSHLTLVIHPAGFKYVPYPDNPVWNVRGSEAHFEARNWEAERGVSFYYEPKRSMLLDSWSGKESDLRGRSARDLTLLRNELYAQYGRSFQDPALRDYFQKQPWYREWSGYSDALLTPAERQKAETILKYQHDHKLTW